jgi:hypothetical protein
MNEAAQLRTRDFRQHEGIWCVVVTASSLDKNGQRTSIVTRQRVKTFAGRRMPLHPMLMKLAVRAPQAKTCSTCS